MSATSHNPNVGPALPKSFGIDALRGASAILVMLSHARGLSFVDFGHLPAQQKTFPVFAFYAVSRLGHEAVMVFFVISGFWVAGPALERMQNRTFDPVKYAVDRATRIVIPLVFAVILTAAVFMWAEHKVPDISIFIGNMLGLNGVLVDTIKYNSALWSLSYEIWFYILMGSIALIVRSRILSISVFTLSVLVFTKLGFNYLAIWLIGGSAYLARASLRGGTIASIGAFIALVGGAGYQTQSETHAGQFLHVINASQSEILIALGVAASLPYLLTIKSAQATSALRRVISSSADFSYSLYLTHLPVVGLMAILIPMSTEINIRTISALFMRMAIVVAVASIFHWLIERQSFRARPWLERKLRSLVGGTDVESRQRRALG